MLARNERKTEALVRRALKDRGYFEHEDLVLEEQQSDNPQISKMLRAASKAGSGAGRPEFIITSLVRGELVILVECKADPAKHESKFRDRFADYAVDGVLLYASHLSKQFDVLAIAVSGQTTRDLKISHFLCLRGGSFEPLPVFGDHILTFDDYWQGYASNPHKFRQDYERLLGYTRDLNELLHAKKIKESQRSLLISGILIALQKPCFRSKLQEDCDSPTTS